MDKIVAIVGNASVTRGLAPFGDESVAIWALTHHCMKMPRVNAVIEMHEDVLTGARWLKYEGIGEYRAWLQTQRETPVWMHSVHADIPASQEYPQKTAARKLRLHRGGEELGRFFGGSASYAIALALHFCYTQIHLYGMELAHDFPEYRAERDAVFYWMGRCAALGSHIHIPKESSLFVDMCYPKE